MPDTKITALTALTAADPANDVLPIVDVSDTTMAASGTTKKISVNNILGCSGTATLASATITGDLTVDTSTLKVDSANNRVGIVKTTPAYPLDVGGRISYSTGIGEGADLTVSSSGTSLQLGLGSSWTQQLFYLSGSEAMRLNSTGLGVGVTPNRKLHIGGTGNQVLRVETITSGDPSINLLASGVNDAVIAYDRTNNYLRFDVSAATGAFIIGPTGNVGVGVTPSTVWTANGNLQVGLHAALYTNASLGATDFAYNSIRTGSDTYQYSFATSLAASRLQQRDGSFRFFTAPAGTSPNAITFTERLRLKETGQLRFVPLAADPAGAEAGDVYYNSTSNKLKCYNGTSWNDLF